MGKIDRSGQKTHKDNPKSMGRQDSKHSLHKRNTSGQLKEPDVKTPFRPDTDTHTHNLVYSGSDEERASLASELQQTYGNRYVQRLAKSMQGKVQRQEEEEELQTKSAGSAVASTASVSADIEARIKGAAGSDQPLSDTAKKPLEQAFGTDFSGVRVHTDAEADSLNKSLSARAFTTGQDVFFGEGEYSPESESGQKLIAHEMTHVVQQGSAERVARWGVTGHERVTELALGEMDLDELGYGSNARKLLADKSAEMDFSEDWWTMSAGIVESAHKIEEFKRKAQSQDAAEKNEAKRMYLENALHRREPQYMRQHGEAGEYKKDGQAENIASVDAKVQEAAGTWSKDKGTSLKKLADALHMAEDRGAHEEGMPWRGHDTRLNKDVMSTAQALGLPVVHHPSGEWDPGWSPDDPTENTAGLKNAVDYAKGVLRDFTAELGQKAWESGEEGPDTVEITKRESKAVPTGKVELRGHEEIFEALAEVKKLGAFEKWVFHKQFPMTAKGAGKKAEGRVSPKVPKLEQLKEILDAERAKATSEGNKTRRDEITQLVNNVKEAFGDDENLWMVWASRVLETEGMTTEEREPNPELLLEFIPVIKESPDLWSTLEPEEQHRALQLDPSLRDIVPQSM